MHFLPLLMPLPQNWNPSVHTVQSVTISRLTVRREADQAQQSGVIRKIPRVSLPLTVSFTLACHDGLLVALYPDLLRLSLSLSLSSFARQ